MVNTTEGLFIPVAEWAADDAKEQVAADTAALYASGLLRPDALSDRLDLITRHAADSLFDGSRAETVRSVQRSLRWATAVELGVAWIIPGLTHDEQKALDAFCTCCRVAHGLVERPHLADEPLVDRLLDTASRLEHPWSDGSIAHQLDEFVRFSRSGEWQSTPWSKNRIASTLAVQPYNLGTELGRRLRGAASTWPQKEFARAFATVQYLAVDICALAFNSHNTRLVTPTGPISLHELQTKPALRQSINEMRATMLSAGATLSTMLNQQAFEMSSTPIADYLKATMEALSFADDRCALLLTTTPPQ